MPENLPGNIRLQASLDQGHAGLRDAVAQTERNLARTLRIAEKMCEKRKREEQSNTEG